MVVSRFSWSPLMATLALVVSSAGCVAPPSGLNYIEMTEQEDVPVPKDFELIHSYSPDETRLQAEARFRHWSGEYVGNTQPGEIVPWYIVQMPNHKWTFKGVEPQPSEESVLRFEKGNETCTINVSRHIDSRRGSRMTFVTAKIRQKGPEDYTVDELLQMRDARAVPASYSPEPGEAEKAVVPATKAGAPQEAAALRPVGASAQKSPKSPKSSKSSSSTAKATPSSPPPAAKNAGAGDSSADDESLEEIRKLEEAAE